MHGLLTSATKKFLNSVSKSRSVKEQKEDISSNPPGHSSPMKRKPQTIPLFIWFQQNKDIGNIFPTVIQILISEYSKSLHQWSTIDIGNDLLLSNENTTVTKIGGSTSYGDWRSIRCNEWIKK